MLTKINDKLDQCRRAIDALTKLRTHNDKEAFEYHFCAYIGFVGAVLQYMKKTLKAERKALKTDLDVATVLGMRNSDVHSEALLVTNQDITIQLTGHELIAATGTLGIEVTDAEGVVVKQTVPTRPPPSPPPPPPSPPKVLYKLDRAALPDDFMIFPGEKKKPDPMKEEVSRHLAETDLGAIAERSYAALRRAIENARSTP
jgi:hypothetical protein